MRYCDTVFVCVWKKQLRIYTNLYVYIMWVSALWKNLSKYIQYDRRERFFCVGFSEHNKSAAWMSVPKVEWFRCEWIDIIHHYQANQINSTHMPTTMQITNDNSCTTFSISHTHLVSLWHFNKFTSPQHQQQRQQKEEQYMYITKQEKRYVLRRYGVTNVKSLNNNSIHHVLLAWRIEIE